MALIINNHNVKQTPIPVVTSRMQITNADGTPTRQGILLLQQLENINVFGASGPNHSIGLVPDPGKTAGATRFLREDATWQVPSGGGGATAHILNPATNPGDLLVNNQVDYTDLQIVYDQNIVYSASQPFTAADIGNELTITGGVGFTPGVYTMMSLVPSTSGAPTSYMILSANVGTVGSTNGTGYTTALTRLGVGTAGQVLTVGTVAVTGAQGSAQPRTTLGPTWQTPAGGGGGGAVTSVFGRTGVVVATAGDYSASQVTNAVDQTASYTNPAWIVSIPWSKITSTPSYFPILTAQNGTGVAIRPEINFISGSNVTVTVADNPSSNRADVTISATAGGSQTPWLSNINGGNYNLTNVSQIAIGGTTPWCPFSVTAVLAAPGANYSDPTGKGFVTLVDTTGVAGLEVGIAPAGNNYVWLQGYDYSLANYAPIVLQPLGGSDTNVGIGVTNPAYKLDVSGDVNISSGSVYRINGTPIGTGAVSSVFGRTGAVVATSGDYTVAQITGAVANSIQVIAGSGLSGGGALTANVTLTAVPMGPSGASHAAGIVPDPGATAGATRYLREDATWAIPSGTGGGMTDPTTTLGDIIVRGSSATTRLGVGTNGQVLTANSGATLGVNWATPASAPVTSVFGRTGAVVAASGDYTAGQITGCQTPWLQNVNAASYNLDSVGYLGVGQPSSTTAVISVTVPAATTGINLTGSGATTIALSAASTSSYSGIVMNGDTAQAVLRVFGSAATVANSLDLSNNTGHITFSAPTERMRVTSVGNVGIGNNAATAPDSVTARVQAIVGPTAVNGTSGVTLANYSTTATSGEVSEVIFANYGISATEKRMSIIQGIWQGGYNSGSLAFWTMNAGTVTERMRISPAGIVGIGTGNNTGAQLQVYGAAQAVTNGSGTTTGISTTGALGGSLVLQDSGSAVGNGGNLVFAANQGMFAAIHSQIGNGTTNTTGDLSIQLRTAVANATLTEYMHFYASGWIGCSSFVGIAINTTPSYWFQLGSDSAAKPSTNTWTIASDGRLKRNIKAFTHGLQTLLRFRPISYEYNGEAGMPEGLPGVGLIAQEAEQVYAPCVRKARGEIRGEKTDVLWTNTSDLAYMMLNALKEIDQRLKQLEAHAI